MKVFIGITELICQKLSLFQGYQKHSKMLLNNKFERNVFGVRILMMSICINTEKCSKDDPCFCKLYFKTNWQLFAVATSFCNA